MWVLPKPCIPAYAKVNNSMQRLTNVKQSTSEKHKEATQDYQGMQKPTGSATLSMSKESIHSSATSLYGTSQLELQHYQLLIYMNLRALMALSVSWPPQRDTHLPHLFQMKDQAIESKSAIKIQDEHAHPQLLFQRLVTVGMKNGELQTLMMNFVTSTLPLVTNVVTTPISVCQYNSKYHKIHFEVATWCWCCYKLQTFLDHLKQCNMS